MTGPARSASSRPRQRKLTALAIPKSDPGRFGLICGLPTSLTYLATDFVRDLMQRASEECEVIPFNTMSEELRARLAEARPCPTLFLAEVPDESIVSHVAAERFPIVVIDQGFAEACRDFISARNLTLLDAARSISRAQVGSIAISAIPRAFIVRPEIDSPASQLAKSIAAAFGVADEVLAAMIRDRALDRPLRSLLEEHFSHIPFVGDQVSEGTLTQLDRIYSLNMAESDAQWLLPLEVLVDGKPPHLPATEPIELVGPSRCLTFGPYFNLPAGRWEACLQFLATGNVPVNSFSIDLLADHETKVDRQFQIEGSGTYRLAFDFEIRDQYQPFEIRTFLRSGAISGTFRLVSLSLCLRS